MTDTKKNSHHIVKSIHSSLRSESKMSGALDYTIYFLLPVHYGCNLKSEKFNTGILTVILFVNSDFYKTIDFYLGTRQ